jgi:hypothetical protein
MPVSKAEGEAKLAAIWPYVERTNKRCADIVKLGQQQVLLTNPAKPLPQTAKDTVLPTAAIALYESEINHLYAS